MKKSKQRTTYTVHPAKASSNQKFQKILRKLVKYASNVLTYYAVICISMRSLTRWILTGVTFAIFGHLHAQDIVIKVSDESGIPIPYVTILDKTDSSTWVTNESGYAILKPGNFNIHLLGFKDINLTITNTDTVLVRLTSDPILLGQVTVNAQASPFKLLNQPQSISVLPLSRIQQYNLPQYATMMNSIPGVYMSTGSINTNKIIIRGIGSRSQYDTEKIRAYLSNIPLTNGSGQSTLEDQDLLFLGQIDVLRGPASSQYGNSLGGTILFTPRIKFGQNESNRIAQIGAYGTRIFGLLNGFQLSPKNHLTLGTQKSHSDGYRDNNQMNRRSFFVSHEYRHHRINLQTIAYHVDQKTFIASSISQSALDADPTQAAFTWGAAKGFEDYGKNLIGTTLTFQINDHWRLINSAFGSHFRNYEPRPFNILKEKTYGFGTRNRLIYHRNLFRWILGQESFRDLHSFQTYQNLYQINGIYGSLEGAQLADLHEKRTYHNIFTQLNYRLNQFDFQGGLNINTTQYKLIDRYPDADDLSGSYKYPITFSPSLSMMYHLQDQTSIHISGNHGFSPPTLEQTLTPEGMINPEIKPETGFQLETGLKRLYTKGYFSFAAYQIWIDDLLTARRTAEDQYIGINAGKTNHMGIEIEQSHRWLDFKNLSLEHNLSGTIGRYRFADFLEEDKDFSGNSLPGIPRFTSYFDLKISGRGFVGTIMHQNIGAMYLNDDNTIMDNYYQLVHTSLTKSIKWKGITIAGGFTINNLLNTSYNSMVVVNAVGFGTSEPRYYYPGLPRNILLQGSLQWN